jgi:uncharacterized caspase-like protein
MRTRRREFLRAGLGAGSLFLPLPYAWVWAQQSDGALKLLRAPKQALVIGNGKYKNVPELTNPSNDARAVGEALKATGFEVTMKIDAGREEMLKAIRAYVQLMEQKKHVGLFYFAGHGLQFAWRNYLLPVDAVIKKIDDVAGQSVDIARLMEGLTKASNPMNVIILDACRDNPFGRNLRVDQKGLSQMDAPNSTLLAYATSPGNTASDGDGANGLYTENLLREIKVPEAKIEDVFKRVRLGVRRKSNGAQIPWESTSLEEDFWFIPPKELKKLSDEEKDRLFKEEQALWERTQAALQRELAEAASERQQKEAAEQREKQKAAEQQEKLKAAELQRLGAAERERALKQQEEAARQEKLKADEQKRLADGERLRRDKEEAAQREAAKASAATLAVEEYLRRYPNGNFSELAQLGLDRVLEKQGEKKIEIASSVGNPYTKGSAAADTRYRIGDSYEYRELDLFSRVEQRKFTQTITRITDTEVIYSNGFVTDLLGNNRRFPDGRRLSPNQTYPLEFTVGKRWQSRWITSNPKRGEIPNERHFHIAARENITVPAGTFNAFRIEATGGAAVPVVGNMSISARYWFAPDAVRGLVAGEFLQKGTRGIGQAFRVELLSFKQS